MNDLDRDFSGQRGYWEPHSALIDFCEPNYVYTEYVAEFWNTVSALGMLALGLSFYFFALPKSDFDFLERTKKLEIEQRSLAGPQRTIASTRTSISTKMTYAAFCVQSIGSAGLHAFLDRRWQKLDEVPMAICALSCVYALECKPILSTSDNVKVSHHDGGDVTHYEGQSNQQGGGTSDSITTAKKTATLVSSSSQTNEINQLWNRKLASSLIATGILLYLLYDAFELFVVFHLLFTPIEFYALGRCAWLCRRYRTSDSSPSWKAQFRQLAVPGLCAYVTAIVFWSLEMTLCPFVRPFHTHAWAWHLLVAVGFNLSVLALELKKRNEAYHFAFEQTQTETAPARRLGDERALETERGNKVRGTNENKHGTLETHAAVEQDTTAVLKMLPRRAVGLQWIRGGFFPVLREEREVEPEPAVENKKAQ
ncbi:unnamed protein product [Amoebophrya sp. A120]|nr:unnamed protein product [Amoebophrya sp. A120]|eukprot:GSA120T00012583001.1